MHPVIRQLFAKRTAYQRVFAGDDGALHGDARVVLADLKRFCYADRSTMKISPATGASDPIAMAFAEGRREVFLRISQFINIDDVQFQKLVEQHSNQKDDQQ